MKTFVTTAKKFERGAAVASHWWRAATPEQNYSSFWNITYQPAEMKNSTVFQLFTTYLLASTGRSFSLISSLRRELRSSKFQSPLFESPSETDSEDLFNENDDSLSGEPRWFNPAARNEISSSIRQSELIDDGVVLRALPIYMLISDQCFPTGCSFVK